jgi:hypothetical protein
MLVIVFLDDCNILSIWHVRVQRHDEPLPGVMVLNASCSSAAGSGIALCAGFSFFHSCCGDASAIKLE